MTGNTGKRKLIDPVKAAGKDNAVDEEMQSLDPSRTPTPDEGLLESEIGAVQQRRTTAPHPFEGYRLGRKVKVMGTEISTTHLVLLKPTEEPPPDASNKGVTVYVGQGEGDGGDPKLHPGRQMTLGTFHTRVVTNRQMNQNTQVVFDWDIKVGQTPYKCAYVPSHTHRAQLVFYFDKKKNRIMVDKRYALADTAQATRLLQIFQSIHWQRTSAERKAKDFDDTPESAASDRPLDD